MSITNTATQKRAIVDGLPVMIEAAESQGQSELVRSVQLPTQVRGAKQKLIDAGVVFGEQCEGDELFCKATLPPGWKKEKTDHSLWSKLVAADGVERALIFYKAAFYDRDAFMLVSE